MFSRIVLGIIPNEIPVTFYRLTSLFRDTSVKGVLIRRIIASHLCTVQQKVASNVAMNRENVKRNESCA